MSKKIKRSVRFSPHNFEMIQALADVVFLNERKNMGDFSKALNWILDCFRVSTEYGGLMKLIEYKARYDRGDRSKETIAIVKHFETILNLKEKETKNSKEEVK